jgi:hypothetical protein
MLSCLGIYVDKNLIKYAKVKRVKNTYKIESSNVEVFEDLEKTIEKIIVETDSTKTPISINISNELYNYFDVYSLLEKKDIAKSLDIEFEMLCDQKGYDKKLLESRYILMDNREDPDKFKSIYISVNKKDLEQKIANLENYKLASISPVSTSITNLIDQNETDNIAIINIENETQITTIVNGQINRVDILNSNLEEVVSQVNRMEMSWKKSYDVFKNITIYDSEVKNINEDENEYAEFVMPVLYKIANETKKLFKNFKNRIDKIYITGMGATINNIDLYFQNFFSGISCEILKPFFVDSTSLKLPVKEFIEVNSAISLALDGLGFVNKDLNFAPSSKFDNIDFEAIEQFDVKNWKEMLEGPLNINEKVLVRGIAVCVIAIICFSTLSRSVVNRIDNQIASTKEKIALTENSLNNMKNDLDQIQDQTEVYTKIVENVDSLNEANNSTANSRVISKDAIPNLLNQIMYIIPQQVQVISIENTENKHIVIEAQSEKYEQLGYFSAAIKNDQVLVNVQSTIATKNDSYVQVTIEGDLQ